MNILLGSVGKFGVIIQHENMIHNDDKLSIWLIFLLNHVCESLEKNHWSHTWSTELMITGINDDNKTCWMHGGNKITGANNIQRGAVFQRGKLRSLMRRQGKDPSAEVSSLEMLLLDGAMSGVRLSFHVHPDGWVVIGGHEFYQRWPLGLTWAHTDSGLKWFPNDFPPKKKSQMIFPNDSQMLQKRWKVVETFETLSFFQFPQESHLAQPSTKAAGLLGSSKQFFLPSATHHFTSGKLLW